MISDFAGVSLSLFALLAVTAFVAGLARGFSGFGAALIFVPLAARFLGPQAAAPLLLLTDGIVALPLMWTSWEKARKPEVALMAVGGFVGVPLGTVALALGDPHLLRWYITVLMAATSRPSPWAARCWWPPCWCFWCPAGAMAASRMRA